MNMMTWYPLISDTATKHNLGALPSQIGDVTSLTTKDGYFRWGCVEKSLGGPHRTGKSLVQTGWIVAWLMFFPQQTWLNHRRLMTKKQANSKKDFWSWGSQFIPRGLLSRYDPPASSRRDQALCVCVCRRPVMFVGHLHPIFFYPNQKFSAGEKCHLKWGLNLNQLVLQLVFSWWNPHVSPMRPSKFRPLLPVLRTPVLNEIGARGSGGL